MINLFLILFISSLILGSLSLLVLMLNTVHSLLLLLEIFIIGSLLLFMFKVEFLGLIFLMIYLGAILVLFLFVVMMLDIKTTAVQNDDLSGFFFKSLGVWVFIPVFIWWFFGDIIICSTLWNSFLDLGYSWSSFLPVLNFYQLINLSTNLEVIGWYIFDFQPVLFVLSGVILYIAMIGAIVISVDSSMNYNQKLQNALVQGMRQGNIVSYISTDVKKEHWSMIPRLHWSIERFPKPKASFWTWLGKNSFEEK